MYASVGGVVPDIAASPLVRMCVSALYYTGKKKAGVFMRKILVSACLCGQKLRYNGSAALCENKVLKKWIAEGRVIPVCPECLGGLSVPRDPCEQKSGHIIAKGGADFTEAFRKGAEATVRIARENDVAFCVLKENSPSCGSSFIYDGTFSGTKIAGEGVATAMLREAGFPVYSEEILDESFDLE